MDSDIPNTYADKKNDGKQIKRAISSKKSLQSHIEIVAYMKKMVPHIKTYM